VVTPPVLDLDDDQRRAVEALTGPVLIVAGPGSGKTRVVTHRIAEQVRRGIADPKRIVAVTFTERAAGELLARLRAERIPVGAGRGVRASTFHAHALRQVRHFWPRVGGEPIGDVLAGKLPILFRLSRRGATARLEPRDLAAEIEWVKAQGAGASAHLVTDGPVPRWRLDPAAYARALTAGHDGPWGQDIDASATAQDFARVFDAFEDAKADDRRVDFDDMLAACCWLVGSDPTVAASVREAFTHFTVDELQDVNRLQWQLLLAWLGDRDELCAVGDPDQAIYGFAGADRGVIASEFRRVFRHTTVVTLTRNYRSTQPILDAATQVVWGGPRDRRTLIATRGTGGPPQLTRHADEDAERDATVAEITALHDQGTPWSEIAILYRTNAQSARWEEALAAARIPYIVRDDTPFLERPHVREAVTALRLAERAGADQPVEDVQTQLDGVVSIRPTVSAAVERVLRQRLRWMPEEPAGDVARARWADLAVLLDIAREHEAAAPDATLADLLADLDAQGLAGERSAGDGVNLLTLHRSKGLEFDAVFVVEVEDRVVPMGHAIRHDDRLGLRASDPRSAVAEESRLLYVGFTRARTHLHVSWAAARGGRGRPRSRFLKPLLPDAAEVPTASPKKARAAAAAADLTDDQRPLFDALKAWRRELADEAGVPAYVVFSDRTLRAIAADRPRDAGALLTVAGVGPTKLERYGDDVLRVVGAHDDRA